jgi:hypothetical protein
VLSPTNGVVVSFERVPTVRDIETLITFLDVTRVAVAQWPLWVKVECGGGTPPEPAPIERTDFATEPRANVASRSIEVEPGVKPLSDFVGTVLHGGTLDDDGFKPNDPLDYGSDHTLYPKGDRPGVPLNTFPPLGVWQSVGAVHTDQSLGPAAAEPIAVTACVSCGAKVEEGSAQCEACNYADNLSSRNDG